MAMIPHLTPAAITALQALVDSWSPEQSNAAAQLKVSTLKALLHAAERWAQIQGLRERIRSLAPDKYGYGEQTSKIARGELLRDLLALLDASPEGNG
jgi:hypothetical protein